MGGRELEMKVNFIKFWDSAVKLLCAPFLAKGVATCAPSQILQSPNSVLEGAESNIITIFRRVSCLPLPPESEICVIKFEVTLSFVCTSLDFFYTNPFNQE